MESISLTTNIQFQLFPTFVVMQIVKKNKNWTSSTFKKEMSFLFLQAFHPSFFFTKRNLWHYSPNSNLYINVIFDSIGFVKLWLLQVLVIWKNLGCCLVYWNSCVAKKKFAKTHYLLVQVPLATSNERMNSTLRYFFVSTNGFNFYVFVWFPMTFIVLLIEAWMYIWSYMNLQIFHI